MRYTIRDITRFTYDTPISESVMEVRMQPRSDGLQRCLHFLLMTSPASRIIARRFLIPPRSLSTGFLGDRGSRRGCLAVRGLFLPEGVRRA